MDYYKTLGISKNATENDIKSAYKKLALKWHPDKNMKNKEEAGKKFSEISEAYSVLSDKEKRANYDNFGSADGPQQQNPHFASNGTQFKFSSSNISPDELFKQFFGTHNIFEAEDHFMRSDLGSAAFSSSSKKEAMGHGYNHARSFARMSAGSGPRHAQMHAQMQPTVKDLPCTLEDLYNGVTKNILIQTNGPQNASNTKEMSLTVLPGFKDGTKLNFERYNGTNNDLIFVIRENPHHIYKRDDNDLHIDLVVTYDEAIKGCTKEIMFLDNKKRMLNINKLAQSNQTQIVEGLGMPIRKAGKQMGYGKLIVHFIIKLC